MPGLRTDNLHFAYPRRRVLAGLSVDFPPGTLTAVLGPNGCGKSTLLRLLLGTLTPSSGHATLDDQPTGALAGDARARRLAYAAQRAELAEGFTVRRYVELGRYALGRDDRGVDDAIARAELSDRAAEPFATLSAGQQQRASLARVLAQLHGGDAARQCVLADEPFSAMDPRHALWAVRTLRELARSGRAVVLVLHELTLAARLADRVILLDERGVLVDAGPPCRVMTPDRLRSVFGVEFDWLTGPAGPALVARV